MTGGGRSSRGRLVCLSCQDLVSPWTSCTKSETPAGGGASQTRGEPRDAAEREFDCRECPSQWDQGCAGSISLDLLYLRLLFSKDATILCCPRQVSPLTRTIETAAGVFGGAVGPGDQQPLFMKGTAAEEVRRGVSRCCGQCRRDILGILSRLK